MTYMHFQESGVFSTRVKGVKPARWQPMGLAIPSRSIYLHCFSTTSPLLHAISTPHAMFDLELLLYAEGIDNYLMTSFTPLSVPGVGMASQTGQFGDEIRIGVRKFSQLVTGAWRSAVGDSARPRKSTFGRLGKTVHRDEEMSEVSSAEPSPSLERRWSQAVPRESGHQQRRSWLRPSVSEVEMGSSSDERDREE